MTLVRAGYIVLVACFLLSGRHSAGQEAKAAYRIKPSEVAVPADVELGNYQRITRPFENWTLICDENLQAGQKVCNVTQIIEDPAGRMVFSWSLAATKEGKPYMILRTAPDADANGLISFRFDGRNNPVEIHIDGCSEAVCIGMLPVGPIMREQISMNATPKVSYETTGGETIVVTTTLKGLSRAVEAID